ncbi:mucin-6-like [Ornithodoros turicata]|uniref:mucin-6-like n=1 Tax=Ornithodoros turicata TaxID=34597 RepID=UPI003139D2F1
MVAQALFAFIVGLLGVRYCAGSVEVIPRRPCGMNEVSSDSCNIPEKSCADQNSVPPRPTGLVPPCICRPGYVRNSIGECISASDCNKCRASDDFSEYQECGTACPLICGKPVHEACIRMCVSGCFCSPGYIRTSKVGPCVPIDTCPPECGPYAHYTTCASNCPAVCGEEPVVCSQDCLLQRGGCDCDEGYILSPDRSRCISDEECRCLRPRHCVLQQRKQMAAEKQQTLKLGVTAKGSGWVQRNKEKCRYCLREDMLVPALLLAAPALVGILGLDVHAALGPTLLCGVNEEPGNSCFYPEQYCQRSEDMIPTLETRTCRLCVCKNGYLRNSIGECVSQADCNRCRSQSNKEFLLCGSACPLVCGRPVPQSCTEQCVSGCFCRPGYISDLRSGLCKRVQDCPPQCGDKERFSMCPSSCPNYCNATAPDGCVDRCDRPGCVCDYGYLRNRVENRCVPRDRCPLNNKPPPCCGKNEVYLADGGTACPPVCDEPFPRYCTAIAVIGCFCRNGYIR